MDRLALALSTFKGGETRAEASQSSPPQATQSSSKASGLRSACVPTPACTPSTAGGGQRGTFWVPPPPPSVAPASFLPPPTSLRSAGCASGAFQPAGHLSAPEGNAAARGCLPAGCYLRSTLAVPVSRAGTEGGLTSQWGLVTIVRLGFWGAGGRAGHALKKLQAFSSISPPAPPSALLSPEAKRHQLRWPTRAKASR